MRHCLVLEALANVLSFFVIKFVVWEQGGGQSFLSYVQCNAAGVNGYPSASPLLSHVGSGATATGGVKDKVTGVGGHEDAALDGLDAGLDYVEFFTTKLILPNCISPQIYNWLKGKIIQISNVPYASFGACVNSSFFYKS